jgi:hypothetical protein
MTLKGKRKALNNDPAGQIEAIAASHGGKVPVKSIHRQYPGAAWQEGNIYHIAKLKCGKLYHLMSNTEPQFVTEYRGPVFACSHLAQKYYRKVSLPDLRAALVGPVSVLTLAEAQLAIICWIQEGELLRRGTVPTWRYCAVRPEGIRSGTTPGRPKPVEGYRGPLIVVDGAFACEDLLRRAFQLDIRGGELKEAFNKVVKVPKVLGVKEHGKDIHAVAPGSDSNLRGATKNNVREENSVSS